MDRVAHLREAPRKQRNNGLTVPNGSPAKWTVIDAHGTGTP